MTRPKESQNATFFGQLSSSFPFAAKQLPLQDMARTKNEICQGECRTRQPLQEIQASLFDVADSLEQGKPTNSPFWVDIPMHPWGRKLIVKIIEADGYTEHVLLSESGMPVLLAKDCESERSVDLFAIDEKSRSCCWQSQPAFRLKYTEYTNEWKLQNFRCENCQASPGLQLLRGGCGVRTLCHVRHDEYQVGSVQALRMYVELPRKSEIWCDCCHGRGRNIQSICNNTLLEASRYDFSDDFDDDDTLLFSRKPSWNSKDKVLTLDFGGRFNKPSAKNFQLVRAICDNPSLDDVVMFFGKKDEDSFLLEFEAPLGLVQAFAIALTTIYSAGFCSY